MSERINLIVDEGIGDVLTQLAGGERKRGEWISKLAKAMLEQQQMAQGSDLEQLRYAFAGITGQVKLVEARLYNMERQVAAMMAQGQNVKPV